MKKLTILFPILILLVAGCSLPQRTIIDDSKLNQPVPLPPEQINDLNDQDQDLKKQNDQIIEENEALENNSNNRGNDPTTSKPINAGWEIYSNERYSYTIEHPSNWYVDTSYSEKDFTQRGPKEDNEFIGGDTIVSNYNNPSSYNMENLAPRDLYSLYLKIYRVDTGISYDQFISSKHFKYDTKENIRINGISAIKLTSTSADHPTGTTVINIFIKVENKMFVFNHSGNPMPQQQKDIANKIITSFLIK